MVVAGIYLIIKIKNNMGYIEVNPYLHLFILIIGGITIIFASMSAIYNKDIKKIIAFSTCSQIGFMFFNLGLNISNTYSSLFHLFTHGFFKALLFITAGILIHSSFNDQDLRKFGSYLFSNPFSYMLFLSGSLSLIAIPFFSGFYSKDYIILFGLFPNSNFLFYGLLLFAASLTSIYALSSLYTLFFKTSNSSSLFFLRKSTPEYSTNNTNYLYYGSTLIILSIFAIIIGYYSKDFILLSFHSDLFSILSLEILSTGFLSLIPFFFFLFIFSLFVLIYFLSNFYPKILNKIYLFFISFVPYKSFFIFFNRKGFFDTLYNYLFSYPILFFSYHISFKTLERGFFEYFGPLGFFRLFFYFASNYNLSNHFHTQNSFNYLFIYFSFLLFFFLSLVSLS